MIPKREFLEEHYEPDEVAALEEFRPLLMVMQRRKDPNLGEAGRLLLRKLWPDEITYIGKTHWIITKDKGLQLLRHNYAQMRFVIDVIDKSRILKRPIRSVVLKARQLGFCFAPQSRILTADLRWVMGYDLQVGDEIVAVDESTPGGKGPARKMRTGRVEAKREVLAKALRFRMSNGESLTLTEQHRMLCRKRGGTDLAWREAGDLRIGDEIRFVTQPWDDPKVEDGWFGGILDGEGSFDSRGSPSINASQLPGPVWDRMVSYLRERGYNYCIEGDNAVRASKFGQRPVPKLVVGRMNELFRLLGQTRPTRFIDRRWWEGRVLPGKRSGVATARVVAIEAMPTQRMIDLQTSTKTFILEGFVSHNSTFAQSWQFEQCERAPNRAALTVSYDDESTKKMFGKVKVIRRNQWFRFGHRKDRDEALELDNGSTFHTKTAGNLSAGRGDTVHYLHCSELSSWENAGEILTGLLQAVPLAPETSIIYESTAKGAVGEFYDAWQRAAAGQSEFIPFFAPWFWDPDYALPFPTREQENDFAKSLNLLERRLLDKHKLTHQQLHWRRFKIRNDLQGSEAKFRQEFPSTPEEAFLTTGMPVFNPEAIMELEQNAVAPLWQGDISLAAR